MCCNGKYTTIWDTFCSLLQQAIYTQNFLQPELSWHAIVICWKFAKYAIFSWEVVLIGSEVTQLTNNCKKQAKTTKSSKIKLHSLPTGQLCFFVRAFICWTQSCAIRVSNHMVCSFFMVKIFLIKRFAGKPKYINNQSVLTRSMNLSKQLLKTWQ